MSKQLTESNLLEGISMSTMETIYNTTNETINNLTNDSLTNDKNKRPPNFSKNEDYWITQAFVSTSEDSTKGANQSSDDFWKAVTEKFYYVQSKDGNIDEKSIIICSLESIMNRFQRRISKEVSSFNKYYKQVVNQKPSGIPSGQYYDMAAKLYEDEKGTSFKFLSCVPVLHKLPKFDPLFKNNSDDANDDNCNYNDIGRVMGQNMDHPMGCKRAK